MVLFHKKSLKRRKSNCLDYKMREKNMKKAISAILIICVIVFTTGCATTCKDCDGKGTVACQKCHSGKITCTICKGKAKYDCDKCAGKGFVTTNQRCSKCADSQKPGYIFQSASALQDIFKGTATDMNSDQYWKKCSSCQGIGYKTETCSACSGSGKGAECKECGGTGVVVCPACKGTLSVQCKTCNGTGKIQK